MNAASSATSRPAAGTALRAAVIGLGVFGRYHAAKYRALPGVTLSGLADPAAEARMAAAEQFSAPVYADWRALIGAVDVVSICSPASCHFDAAYAFLEAGADVLVEKPIAATPAEARALSALAARSGRVLQVGHQERFVFKAAGLLDRGRAPLAIECLRMGPAGTRGLDVSVVLDLMIHDLDLVHQLAGDLAGVARVKAKTHHGEGSIDEVKAEITLASGASARLVASRMAKARERRMRLVYEDGELEIDFLTRTIRNTTGDSFALGFDADPLAESIGAFVAAARAGAAPQVSADDGVRALETAAEIDRLAARALSGVSHRPGLVGQDAAAYA